MDTIRILILDDNPAIHEDIRKVLELRRSKVSPVDALEAELFGVSAEPPETLFAHEFVLDSAHQGEEGHRMVKAAVEEGRPYALAFVDVRMPPGWDGIETIAHLWEEDPSLQIVICTAYSDHSWNDIVRRLGPSDNLLVLKKPFDSVEVLQTTSAMTRKWALHQQLRSRLTDLEATVQNRSRDLERINEELRLEILERHRAEASLKHLATHDSLTDLPNRILLYEFLHQAFARARRDKRSVGLLLLDLDHFKEVNDSLGHSAGDILLQEVAKRLCQHTRECDTVARMGGDEFVVTLGDLADPETAGTVAQRINESFRLPFTVGGDELHMTASIGIALHPRDALDVESLVKIADVAMYKAKREGRSTHRFHTQGDEAQTFSQFNIRADLAGALEREEFELYYQPLHALDTMAIAGMEALLRWHHPQRGLVSPIHFIHIAETSGLISSIGEWVLRTACRQTEAWGRSGLRCVPLAVNISARQLYDEDLVETVRRCLAETRVEPGLLEIELTESTATRDLAMARSALLRLHDLGVRIVIDDFGSGYSSLSRLKTLPVDALKIDRFFVQNVADDPRDAAIVTAIIALARTLGIQVVAEGVETQQQLDFLRGLTWDRSVSLRCERVQGFLLHRPMPADEAGKLLTPRE